MHSFFGEALAPGMSRIVTLAESGLETAVDLAAAALAVPGAVILTPTETVYGLVCRAGDAAAVRRIYELKDRDSSKPLGWFVADWRSLAGFGVRLEGLPAELAAKYCPGPITIIAPKQDGGTVGFRVPDHPFMLELLRRVGCPLAQTSANLSGHPNALTVGQALAELSGDLPLAVDGGPIAAEALASTVVDATSAVPRILRQGALRVIWQPRLI